jgi:hypothetical protein
VPSKVKACPVVGTVESRVEVAPLESVLIVRPPPPETVAHLSSVPSKDRTCPVVGAVAFKVVAAALDRDEMESFAVRSESTEALL